MWNEPHVQRLGALLAPHAVRVGVGGPQISYHEPSDGPLRAGLNVFAGGCAGRCAAAVRPQNVPPAPPNSWPRDGPEALRGWSSAQARLQFTVPRHHGENFCELVHHGFVGKGQMKVMMKW